MTIIVLKTVERCNINCTYCYFFNKSDQAYHYHPPFISKETIDKVARFIAQGCVDLSLINLQVTFHGGEPLMQSKCDFDYMCNKILKETSHTSCKIAFGIQTNAMLVNQDWIDLFNKYKVSVGVSIDGPKQYHDKYRVDKRGRGTFDKTVSGIKQLQEGKINFELGILSVINPKFSPVEIFNFFYRKLNISKFDFLLPDAHHGDPPEHNPEEYGDFYCDIFNEIEKVGLENVNVRFINSVLSSFLAEDIQFNEKKHLQPITISTDGSLSPVDDLRNTDSSLMYTGHIDNMSLNKYLKKPVFEDINQARDSLPKTCKTCCWSNVCKGGHLIHRYSSKDKFERKSIYCAALKKLYGRAAAYLINEGISLESLESTLGIE